MSRTLKTPSTPEEWDFVARRECSSERLRLGLQALPAHERDSASKMRLSQFITLRTLWICHDGRSLVYGNHTECDGRSVPHSDWLDHNLVSDSRAWLSGWPPFQRYIGRLRDRQDPTRQDTSDPDVLSLVHVFQQDVRGLPGMGSRPDSPKYAIACRTRARVLASQAQHSSSPLAAKSRGRERTKTKVSSLFGRSAIEPVEELNIGLDQLQLESSLTPPPLALASPMSHSSPFTTGTFEAAADEEIVNHALVALLTGLTVYDHEITARWSGARLNLKISDLLNAKTDGFLRSARDSSALAILEVKARLRADRKTSIQFQESAQMAAWIYQCGSDGALKGAIIPGRQRRLLISQDHREIYVVLAEYGSEFCQYLNDSVRRTPIENIGKTGPFLTMHEFGPFDTNDYKDMHTLLPILHYFTRLQSRAQRVGSDKGKSPMY